MEGTGAGKRKRNEEKNGARVTKSSKEARRGSTKDKQKEKEPEQEPEQEQLEQETNKVVLRASRDGGSGEGGVDEQDGEGVVGLPEEVVVLSIFVLLGPSDIASVARV